MCLENSYTQSVSTHLLCANSITAKKPVENSYMQSTSMHVLFVIDKHFNNITVKGVRIKVCVYVNSFLVKIWLHAECIDPCTGNNRTRFNRIIVKGVHIGK